MNPDQLRYKIGIGLIPKIGPVLTRRLIAYCGSAEGVFQEKRAGLAKIPGIGDRLAEYVHANRNLDLADAELEWVKKYSVDVLFYLDPEYPDRLKQCEDAPVILYARGNANLNRAKIISLVGTRNPTDEGRKITRDLVETIAASYPELLIVSGLAYGIDTCAHKNAIRYKLDNVAVLGHGLSFMYPPSNRDLAVQIASKGALLTEYMHDEKPESANFIKRNRIIAGMADATIVIESGDKGGALITADIANSYNRDVFAVPGRITDKYSAGCNRLIKTNRAALLESIADLEYLMNWQKSKQPEVYQASLFEEMTDEERLLTGLLKTTPCMTIDQLALMSDFPVSKTSSVLLTMEFKGIVKCLPGRVYKLN
jgi:DNA processing protein